MSKFIALGVCASVTLLSACSGGSTSYISTGFASLSGTSIPVSLRNEVNGGVTSTSVGRAAYVAGTNDSGMVAQAGFRTTSVGTAVTSGTATYVTTYDYIVADDLEVNDSLLTGVYGYETGTVSLAADFDAGTLTGSTSQISVDGDISGTDLSGSVTTTYDFFAVGDNYSGSVTTSLDGEIGSTGVIGAFHGSDGNTAVAGALVGGRL